MARSSSVAIRRSTAVPLSSLSLSSTALRRLEQVVPGARRAAGISSAQRAASASRNRGLRSAWPATPLAAAAGIRSA
uniref:Uncharacterized protein n=1 Tax=Oryza sativa subsp. japonica TaxID=39947 RepID=Q7XIW3_ORYSJ|nr:hypothetical protein [Oryza sativa Japonica Group]